MVATFTFIELRDRRTRIHIHEVNASRAGSAAPTGLLTLTLASAVWPKTWCRFTEMAKARARVRRDGRVRPRSGPDSGDLEEAVCDAHSEGVDHQ